MLTESLFSSLESISHRPPAFSIYTARELWTDLHTAEQMLAFHLNSEIDVSSRRIEFIDASISWITTRFNLSDKSRVIDFGCGPGLYTSRLARLGAKVTGVDFSRRSIEFAKERAREEGHAANYVLADYLEFEPEGHFDLITMIMCDICALSPEQRAVMYSKFSKLLADGGRVLLDAYSLASFVNKKEGLVCEKNQLDGFWSAAPYFGFVSSFRYEDEKVTLDKYTIVEKQRQREIYNWLQYFSPESLEREVDAFGLRIDELYGDVSGGVFDSSAPEFAIVMRKK